LAVILAAISVLYYNINRRQQLQYHELEVVRDSIKNDLTSLISEYDSLQYQNDTISARLVEANELVEQLKYERRLNYNRLRAYEKEVGTLRTVMKRYLRQIDSLNSLNKKLINENVSYRKEISSANLRAERAEEKASELKNKVQQGAILRARDISLVALNAKGNQVSRVRTATTLRVDFTLNANELTTPGNREVYVRITSPDGYILSTEQTPTFEFEGGKLSYSASREVDYQNEDVDVSIFYNGSGFAAGTYKVQLYSGGYMMGSTEVALR
jgi:DNA repair ATPase RecN